MEAIRRQYYRFLLVFMVLLCAMCVALSFWAIDSAEKIHVKQTYEEIYAIKRVFLKDTVQNMIGEIGRIRESCRDEALAGIVRLREELRPLVSAAPVPASAAILALLRRVEYGTVLNILFEDTKRNVVLFGAGEASGSARFSEYLDFGTYRLQIGVNESRVDELTKSAAANIIHNQRFQDGTYLWVNEIRNWAGGDNYAVRRIHPHLKDTEGSFLSTNTRDIRGNMPYLKELLGVRDHRELYFNYFFKKPGSDEIGEKLSYATLYPDYDWIVAMGIYLDDIQVFIDAARKETADLSLRVAVAVAVSIAVLFFSAILALSWMETWYMQRTSLRMRMESNTDPLTGAFNRRLGLSCLQDAFGAFKRGLDSPALFSFDLDNFKKVNDAFGHDAGDLALKAVVAKIRANMRNTDLLFRWGGEEFLLLCNGLLPEFTRSLAEKLNREIEMAEIDIGMPGAPRMMRVTISIGISRFAAGDNGPEAALKRADEAMFEAKAAGRNCAREK